MPKTIIIILIAVSILAAVFIAVGKSSPSFLKNQLQRQSQNAIDLNPADDQTENTDSAIGSENWAKVCNKEVIFEHGALGKVRVTGKENFRVKGNDYEICCYEYIDFSEDRLENPAKICSLTSQPDAGTVIFELIDGKYIPTAATLTIDNKQCGFGYDGEGNIESEFCQ